jgi:hypothetical protein
MYSRDRAACSMLIDWSRALLHLRFDRRLTSRPSL